MAGMTPLGNRLPTCLTCLRRLAQPTSLSPASGILVQARAKSNYTRPYDRGVVVRLLEDVPTFGRKHAVFRTERGRMRNQWYPAGKAEYMTRQRFQELGLAEDDVGERDRTFGVVNEVEEEDEIFDFSQPQAPAPTPTGQSPETAHSLLSMLLPETLTFYRNRITKKTTPKSSEQISQDLPVAQAAEEDDASGLDLYGSVSTTDIVHRIREFLVTDAEGSQITLAPENITITGTEDNKVKALGRWEVDIHIANAPSLPPVRKIIEVLPQ
ncbi:hypothetical protein V8F20_006552 [Naviculisporaceae sp. PSN 640]